MRILAGGPTRNTGQAYEAAWRTCIEAQASPGVEVVFHALDADGGGYKVGETGHHWSRDAVHRVARTRQAMIYKAMEEGYDALWMVDDDVLCGPGVLDRLLGRGCAVVFGVFWTPGWRLKGPNEELPQVWDHHPYGLEDDTMGALRGGDVRRVAGGGACSLIPASAMAESVYWPPLLGVEHWWEDRWACLRWAARDVPMIAVPGMPIHHAYGEAQRTPEAINAAMRRLWGTK